MKTRRGWYLVDIKTYEDDRRIRDEKEAALVARRASMVKRCDEKIARRRAQAEQREAVLAEELSRARAADEAKQEEIELTHRLAAELSRRRNEEEIKRALKKPDRAKSCARSPSSCAAREARLRLTEEKARLEASQAGLLRLWREDRTVEELRRAEDERKKRCSRDDLQNRLANNRRRVQRRRADEKERDREMVECAARKAREEDAEVRKRKMDNAILLRAEMAMSLAAKKAWDRRYKEALRDEDERIARAIAEQEARREKELGVKTKLRAAKEAAIDNVARKLLADVCKEKKRQEVADELYRAEWRSKWTKEAVGPRKQCAESFHEMKKQKAERKAREEAIDAAFERYLAEEEKKAVEKQSEDNNARHARNIQYGKELKETIVNNRVTHVMDILERQSELHVHDKNSNQLTATNVKQQNISNDRNDNNKIAKKRDVGIRSCAE